MTLAYVFWHTPVASVALAEYETALLRFHEALRAAAPAGFLESRVLRCAAVPWLASERPVYEDWYLLDGSAALDAMEEAAIAGLRQQPHDAVARLAAAATAGLYLLRRGDAALVPAAAHWLAKPAGESYEAFYRRFPEDRAAPFALWGRKMTLGPGPEFCLHRADAVPSPLPAQESLAVEPLRGERRGVAVD
jgi:hypothetical protein